MASATVRAGLCRSSEGLRSTMKSGRRMFAAGVVLTGLTAIVGAAAVAQAPASPPRVRPAVASAETRAVLDRYWITCHNQQRKTAGLLLDQLDVTRVSENTETWVKV